jgi:hypothetical protein
MAHPRHRNLPKPSDMFARDWEWSELAAFATAEGAGPRLAVVSGRRRRGKTFLLTTMARQETWRAVAMLVVSSGR